MKLILYFGHTGTTKKASEILATSLEDTVIMDGMKKNQSYSSSFHLTQQHLLLILPKTLKLFL